MTEEEAVKAFVRAMPEFDEDGLIRHWRDNSRIGLTRKEFIAIGRLLAERDDARKEAERLTRALVYFRKNVTGGGVPAYPGGTTAFTASEWTTRVLNDKTLYAEEGE